MSELQGVDLGGLSDDWGKTEGSFPPVDPELVHLCDADIGAYEVANLEKPDVENFQDFLDWIEYRRLLCGAYRSIPFVTAGTKGGRYELAILREYQGNRKAHRDPGLANRVRSLRSLLAERDPRCVVGTDQEADDLICQYQVAALRTGSVQGGGKRTITDSTDKDLRMFPGLHLCPKSLEPVDVSGYGSCWIDESTSSKRVLGWGTSFFWHQLLMGDQADNIPGLPYLAGRLANRYQPTAAILKAQDRLREGGTEKQLEAAARALRERKPLKIGPVLAHAVLEGVTDDLEALRRVREAYYEWYGPGVFEVEDWRGTIRKCTAGHMLLEQARLLWMRRVPGECVTTFFKEICDGVQ